MPQDAVSAALNSAKSALAHANTSFPSPKPAAAPAAAPLPKTAAPAGIGQELKAKQDNVRRYATAPKMHNGGPVPADGVYTLRAGEYVLTAPEAAKARKHALMASGLKSLAKVKGK